MEEWTTYRNRDPNQNIFDLTLDPASRDAGCADFRSGTFRGKRADD